MSMTALLATLDRIYNALPEDDRVYGLPSATYMNRTMAAAISEMEEMVGSDNAEAMAAIDAALDDAAGDCPGFARLQEYKDNPNLTHWYWYVPEWDRRPCNETDRCRRTLTARMIDLFDNGTYQTY